MDVLRGEAFVRAREQRADAREDRRGRLAGELLLDVLSTRMRKGPTAVMSRASTGSAARRCASAATGSNPSVSVVASGAAVPLMRVPSRSIDSMRSLVVMPPVAENPPTLPRAASTR